MDIIITEVATKTKLVFAVNPESVKQTAAAKLQKYEIMDIGDTAQPHGVDLIKWSWQGTILGAARKALPMVKSTFYRTPRETEKFFEKWRKEGTILSLMITDTNVNKDCVLESFDWTMSGGWGDAEYSITLVEYKTISIKTVQLATTAATTTTTRTTAPSVEGRTHTVVRGDTLWGLAKTYLGNGARYPEIYNLNRDKISNPNLIHIGWALKIPAK